MRQYSTFIFIEKLVSQAKYGLFHFLLLYLHICHLNNLAEFSTYSFSSIEIWSFFTYCSTSCLKPHIYYCVGIASNHILPHDVVQAQWHSFFLQDRKKVMRKLKKNEKHRRAINSQIRGKRLEQATNFLFKVLRSCDPIVGECVVFCCSCCCTTSRYLASDVVCAMLEIVSIWTCLVDKDAAFYASCLAVAEVSHGGFRFPEKGKECRSGDLEQVLHTVQVVNLFQLKCFRF